MARFVAVVGIVVVAGTAETDSFEVVVAGIAVWEEAACHTADADADAETMPVVGLVAFVGRGQAVVPEAEIAQQLAAYQGSLG